MHNNKQMSLWLIIINYDYCQVVHGRVCGESHGYGALPGDPLWEKLVHSESNKLLETREYLRCELTTCLAFASECLWYSDPARIGSFHNLSSEPLISDNQVPEIYYTS